MYPNQPSSTPLISNHNLTLPYHIFSLICLILIERPVWPRLPRKLPEKLVETKPRLDITINACLRICWGHRSRERQEDKDEDKDKDKEGQG